jgi:L-alanine-DL-glutamate epimerase-like enolase superfamily enzyme
VAAYALSAVDIGLWDIAGKAAGLPLYKLWGAHTDRIPAYGSGGWPKYAVEDLVREAERYAGMGCRYYKLKVHHPDPRMNRQRVEAVRRALGDDVRLMVDVNQRLDVLGNLRLARELEDLDLVWYEEPVLADDIAACAEVARSIAIPVATGENNYTRFEFRELLERRAARYLMPDVCRANGFSETLRIGHLAAAHEVPVAPHVVHELSLHVVGALANGFLVEFIDWTPPDLFEDMPRCEGGHFRVPDRPGHGMALAPGAATKYRAS